MLGKELLMKFEKKLKINDFYRFVPHRYFFSHCDHTIIKSFKNE